MYYVAALMCTIMDVLSIIVSIPTGIVLFYTLVLHEWKDTLEEQREVDDG
jgi:hypothetical protein